MTSAQIHKNSLERGVALLFVLFLMLLVLIGASAAILRFKSQGLREKEAVMIWRGKQYERAIGLYYRKFGHYPTSLDELVKGVNGVRFLREAYKDPMNTEDGSWRFIYVTPAGQIIGSVRYISLQQVALEDRARIMGISLSQETGSDNGQGNGTGAPPGASDQSGNGSPLGAPPAPGSATGGSAGSPPPDQSGQQSGAPPQPTPPQQNPFSGMPQIAPVIPPDQQGQPQVSESSGEIIGGFIVGVGSKIDKPSLKVYKGGSTYKQWEFIYNPLEQVQTFGGGTVIGGVGTNPLGPQPGAPIPQPPQPQQPQIPQSQQQ